MLLTYASQITDRKLSSWAAWLILAAATGFGKDIAGFFGLDHAASNALENEVTFARYEFAAYVTESLLISSIDHYL